MALTQLRPGAPAWPGPWPAAASRPLPGGGDGAATRRWLQSTCVMVLAGGRGTRMRQLTDRRSKPAVPFAGSLRIIDFALGNCINSGLRRVSVLTQYQSQGLADHVRRTWGPPGDTLGVSVEVVPAPAQAGGAAYGGTADAVWQNFERVRGSGASYVLVLAGDHVYRMDHGRLLADHVARRADVTVACVEVTQREASGFGVVCAGADGRISAFVEKPPHPECLAGRPGVALASMGIYVFSVGFLGEALARDAADARSTHDFGHDLIPRAIDHARVYAHDFATSCVGVGSARPYWRDVGTLDAYWEAHMDLTLPGALLDPFDAAWPIRSEARQWAPARFESDAAGRPGMAHDSLVCGGCVVSGATVRRSVLFEGVHLGPGSVVEESLLLPGVVVGRGAVLRRAIVDEGCVLPDGIAIGVDADADRARYSVTEAGITLVTPGMLGPGAGAAG